MSKKSFGILFITLLVFSLSTTSLAHGQVGSIKGKVVIRTNPYLSGWHLRWRYTNPIVGSDVKLESFRQVRDGMSFKRVYTQIDSTTSDQKGEFQFSALTTNYYRITATHTILPTALEENVYLLPGKTVNVILDFRSYPTPVPPTPQPSPQPTPQPAPKPSPDEVVTEHPDLSGEWADGKAIIEQSGSNLTVKMPGRGSFSGKFTSEKAIDVKFNSACCTGEIISADKIKWSNNTIWNKETDVISGYPDLTGTWAGGKAIITQTGDKLTVKMPGRAIFYGSFTSSNEIKVDFTDDRPCCTGTVVSQDKINWSNGSVWHRKK